MNNNQQKINLNLESEITYSEVKLKAQLERLGLLHNVGEHNVTLLCKGLPTTLVENIKHNGRIYDGKFTLQVDAKGNYNLHFNKKKTELEIPQEILGKKISLKDKQYLLQGDTLGPFIHKPSKTEYFLCIDKELNAVTLKTAKQLCIPNEMLGHKFTREEKAQLANNKPVGPRVFCIDNQYFIGTFSMHQVNAEQSMSMLIDKEITQEQAMILSQQYKPNSERFIPEMDMNSNNNEGLFIPKQENITLEEHTQHIIPLEPVILPKTLVPTPTKSFTIDKNGIIFQYNETFGYQTVTYNKEYGFMPKIYGYHLTNEDIKALKEGNPLINRQFILKNGQTFTGHIYLNQTNVRYQFVVEPVSKLNPALLPQQQLFTELDRKVMDLVDKKNFKELNLTIKSGYKPSEDVQNLIFKNNRLSLQDKKELAKVFDVDKDKVLSLHQEKALKNSDKTDAINAPGSKRVPSKDDIKEKNKPNNKDKFLNTMKGLFHDM